jgi:hypothetical protein
VIRLRCLNVAQNTNCEIGFAGHDWSIPSFIRLDELEKSHWIHVQEAFCGRGRSARISSLKMCLLSLVTS